MGNPGQNLIYVFWTDVEFEGDDVGDDITGVEEFDTVSEAEKWVSGRFAASGEFQIEAIVRGQKLHLAEVPRAFRIEEPV